MADEFKDERVKIDSGRAVQPKKYQTYQLSVDPNQDDKATEIKLCNFSRPHMRAFHLSWWSFFVAYFIWFAIDPLLSEIRYTLGLTKSQVQTSDIVSLASGFLMYLILGPACDKYGARVLFTAVLCFASIPLALTGLVNDLMSLTILRLFIGVAGGSFVMCQYWTSRMFTKEVVGTANALVGGWGNLGGGVSILVMRSVLFPLFQNGMSVESAWRMVCVVPAVVAFTTGLTVYFNSDDAPKGNYAELKKNGLMPKVSASTSFFEALNLNTWVLFIQYGCCFGVELIMINAAVQYLKDEFGQTTESPIASIFFWMKLFARVLGGYASDKANAKMGMRGRLLVQTVLLVVEGLLVLIFVNTNGMLVAVVIMVFFSVFAQAAQGSTYGIVPYVNPPATGSIVGIVGAGGISGALVFRLCFQDFDKKAFIIMGFVIILSGLISIFVNIKGHAGLIFESDSPQNRARASADP